MTEHTKGTCTLSTRKNNHFESSCEPLGREPFLVEKSLFFPEIWDYQISAWMMVSFLTAVSMCANIKMERVMPLYISSAFGFPTGHLFCLKAAIKIRNQCHILKGLELRLKSVLLPNSPLWNSLCCAGVQEKAWHKLLMGSHMEIMFFGAKIIPPWVTWEKCKNHTTATEAIQSALNNTQVLNTSPMYLQQWKQVTQKFHGFHLPVTFQKKLLLWEYEYALQHWLVLTTTEISTFGPERLFLFF